MFSAEKGISREREKNLNIFNISLLEKLYAENFKIKNFSTGECFRLYALLLRGWSRPSTTLSSWTSFLLRRTGEKT